MRPVKFMLRLRDPAPSRFGFRVKRLWRSERFRRAVTVWAPIAVIGAVAAWAFAQPELRAAASGAMASARAEIAARPEIALRRIVVRGAGADVAGRVRAVLEPYRGVSSLDVDVDAIRRDVGAIGWVATAKARLEAPEGLIVTVTERRPAAIWRRGGQLALVDVDGALIAPIEARAERADLPVLAGPGADRAVPEALEIIAAAEGLAPRLRGLVRIGERRWDMILDGAPKIMLPASGAVGAMGYLAALQAGEDVLGRDVAAVDLRLKGRPTLKLNPDAADALRASRTPKAPGEDA